MKRTEVRPKITVTADGRGVVGHAGARLLADVAEATGAEYWPWTTDLVTAFARLAALPRPQT